jgi:hypothetical protein
VARRHPRRGAWWALGLLIIWRLPAEAQLLDTLSTAQIDSATIYLQQALAGASEPAYLQVLTSVGIVVDPNDTVGVHDLIARYDPDRFHDPHLGIYPLTFEDQFIQWGKRIALFTRSSSWNSSRFYLHDISTGEQAWIYTWEARRLYPVRPVTYPPAASVDNRPRQAAWLQLIYAADPGTDLRSMSEWLRLMRREARETVVARERQAAGG